VVIVEAATALYLPHATESPWDPTIERITGEGPGRFRHHYADPGPLQGLSVEIEVVERHPTGGRFRTVAQGEDAAPARSETPVEAAPHASGTRLTVTERAEDFPAATLLAAWLDDMMADHLDRFAAYAEGRPDMTVGGADRAALSAMMEGGGLEDE